jgi:hypothetical protein
MDLPIQRERVFFDWVVIMLFLSFISLPELNRQFQFIPDTITSEQRTLNPYRVFDIRKVSDFTKKFDLFYNDHFGFRLQLMTLSTLIHTSLFGLSGVRHVIIGKYNWLFFNQFGVADPKGISSGQGFYPYSAKELMVLQNRLEIENEWFIKRNITFFILPSPDKHSIYPEYLPWQYDSVVGPSKLTQIFEHMKLHSKLQLIDVKQALLNAKNIYPLNVYFKTDTHWNNIGAFVAYEEIMKRLLVIYPELLPHRFEDFIQDRKLERRGDLAIMANLNVSHILEHQFIPKQNSTYHNMGPKKRKILLLGDHRWNRSGFLATGTGTGLKNSDRTGPAVLPVNGRSNFSTDTNYIF